MALGTAANQSAAQTAAQIQGWAAKAPANVVGAIRAASQRTGADFSYLMAQAAQESSFKPDAKASTSSARGLYQFIDRTWLETVRDSGAKHGMGDLAAQIEGAPGEMPRVRDPQLKKKILDMRDDPFVSSVMAAEYANANKQTLAQSTGTRVGSTELYLAHFLGPSGATRFLTAMRADPSTPAADVLPEAASANRSVFYANDTGRALSVGEVYTRFNRTIAGKADAFKNENATLADIAATSTGLRDNTHGANLGSRAATPGWNGPPGGIVAPETVLAISRINQQLAQLNAKTKVTEAEMRAHEERDRKLMAL